MTLIHGAPVGRVHRRQQLNALGRFLRRAIHAWVAPKCVLAQFGDVPGPGRIPPGVWDVGGTHTPQRVHVLRQLVAGPGAGALRHGRLHPRVRAHRRSAPRRA